jgi:hypothetical protein
MLLEITKFEICCFGAKLLLSSSSILPFVTYFECAMSFDLYMTPQIEISMVGYVYLCEIKST